jgi:phytoene dehydrogenase-like protein
MKGFMQFLEKVCHEKNIQVLKSAKVEKIAGHDLVLTDGRSFKGDEFILNLPCWNIPALFPKDKDAFLLERAEEKSAWGAFVVYLGIKGNIRDSYHQIHLNHPLVKNYFASFSIPEDLKRAPTGWQSVTISTHIDAASWFEMEKVDYREAKQEIMQIILEDFKKRFDIQETKYVTGGTPKTFERYTGRHLGYVGGLPFLFGSNPWKLIGHKTPISNVFRVGDTTFPGQGVVGVVAGALALHQEMIKK